MGIFGRIIWWSGLIAFLIFIVYLVAGLAYQGEFGLDSIITVEYSEMIFMNTGLLGALAFLMFLNLIPGLMSGMRKKGKAEKPLVPEKEFKDFGPQEPLGMEPEPTPIEPKKKGK